MTAVAGRVFTASQYNTFLRDNLLETEAAKATGYGQAFAATGRNAIAARQISEASVSTSETLYYAAYANMTTVGPAVTATTGTSALVICTSLIGAPSGYYAYHSYAVSGATTRDASDAGCTNWRATGSDQVRGSAVDLCTGLTPGVNTFTSRYKAPQGLVTFMYRSILVWPF